MPQFQKALEEIEATATALATGITKSWQQRAEEVLGAPLPPELDLDSLPELIRTLARASYSKAEQVAIEEMIRTAIRHGKDRRSAGYSDSVVFREYHLLRRYLWDAIKAADDSKDAVVAAILRIDAAMTAATAASAHGFHLDETPAEEERLIRRMVDEWTMPLQ